MRTEVETAGWSARAAAEARHPEAPAAFGIVIRPLRPARAHALAGVPHARHAAPWDAACAGAAPE